MKILIIDSSDNRFGVDADTFELTGNCIRLYRKEHHEDAEIARPESIKLIAVYWGIMGFEVLEE